MDEGYRFFENNGCVIFDNGIEESDVSDIRAQLESVIQQQVSKHLSRGSPFLEANGFDRGLIELADHDETLRKNIYDVVQSLSSVYRFSTNPAFTRIATDLGIKIPIMTVQLRMDLPGDERFLIPPHQEICGIRSHNLVFMWIPLVDVSNEMGALSVAPGSHQLGPIVPTVSDDNRYQFIPPELYMESHPIGQIPMESGEMVVLGKHVIHGSHPNTTDRPRWACIFRFEDAANMPFLDGDDSLDQFNLKGG